jgi:hypothetical protein
MIESLMWLGIGLLGGCLLMLAFYRRVHERAVRLTKRSLVEATPLTVNEIQADKDALRAQFAVSVRRLELGMEEMRAKASGRRNEAGKQTAEIGRLLIELDRKTAQIVILQARDQVRRNVARRIVKILAYMYLRAGRRRRKPVLVMPDHLRQWDFSQSEASDLAAAAALNVKRRQAASRRH